MSRREPRSHRHAFIALGVVAVTTLGALVLVRGAATPPSASPVRHHADGKGPLRSTGDPAFHGTFGLDPAVGGPAWTIGIYLCIERGTAPAVLDGWPAPTRIAGGGLKLLGAYVRRFQPTTADVPIYSANEFPPSVPDSLLPMRGYAVTNGCSTSAGPPLEYTELLIGVGEDPAFSGGGGWQGIDIGYESGGARYVVSLGYDIFVCGRYTPAQYCGGPSAGR